MDAPQPEQTDCLDRADKWADRLLKYGSVLAMLGCVVTAFFGVFVKYLLPRAEHVAPGILLAVSLVAVTVGHNRVGPRTWWRFTCTIFAVLSLGGWGYSLTSYRIHEEVSGLPRIVDVQVWRPSDNLGHVDAEAIRQQERNRIDAEYRVRWTQTVGAIATWMWFGSLVLWCLAFARAIPEVGAVSRGHQQAVTG